MVNRLCSTLKRIERLATTGGNFVPLDYAYSIGSWYFRTSDYTR